MIFLRIGVLMLLLAGCRTPPLDPVADLAKASSRDLAVAPDLVSCACGSDELCVLIDCQIACVAIPTACLNDRTCRCIGDAVCPPPPADQREPFMCFDQPTGPSIQCASAVLCLS